MKRAAHLGLGEWAVRQVGSSYSSAERRQKGARQLLTAWRRNEQNRYKALRRLDFQNTEDAFITAKAYMQGHEAFKADHVRRVMPTVVALQLDYDRFGASPSAFCQRWIELFWLTATKLGREVQENINLMQPESRQAVESLRLESERYERSRALAEEEQQEAAKVTGQQQTYSLASDPTTTPT